jgi:hypothetical protein
MTNYYEAVGRYVVGCENAERALKLRNHAMKDLENWLRRKENAAHYDVRIKNQELLKLVEQVVQFNDEFSEEVRTANNVALDAKRPPIYQ